MEPSSCSLIMTSCALSSPRRLQGEPASCPSLQVSLGNLTALAFQRKAPRLVVVTLGKGGEEERVQRGERSKRRDSASWSCWGPGGSVHHSLFFAKSQIRMGSSPSAGTSPAACARSPLERVSTRRLVLFVAAELSFVVA